MVNKVLVQIFSFAVIFGSVACNNKSGPGTVEVKVINNAGLVQSDITVRLFCTEPGCMVEREGKTNELGVYTETFDLPAVLRARAVRYDTTVTFEGLPPNEIRRISVDSVCGEGFVQIENDKIATETITILDCTPQ